MSKLNPNITENSDMDKKVLIYALLDPFQKQIRYVGKTTDLERRIPEHLKYETRKSHKYNWIKKLQSEGLNPIIRILERNLVEGEWQEREKFWIKKFREDGCNLTNISDGGESGTTGLSWKKTPEQIRNFAEARRRAKPTILTSEQRARATASVRATWAARKAIDPLSGNHWGHHTLESKQQISDKLKGRKKSAEHIRKMADSKRGKKLRPRSEEQKKHHAEYMKKWWADESNQKLVSEKRAAKGSQKFTEETRTKMSASAKARCDRQRIEGTGIPGFSAPHTLESKANIGLKSSRRKRNVQQLTR